MINLDGTVIQGYEATWNELDNYINSIKSIDPHKNILKMAITCPIDNSSIDALIAEGWNFEFSDKWKLGGCNRYLKIIELTPSLTHYSRDKVLFHEIVHAWYGDYLNDRFGFYADENNAIVDWLARKSRANPKLLRHTIDSFGLERQIYDYPSCKAFADFDIDDQLEFPFAFSCYDELRKTLMD